MCFLIMLETTSLGTRPLRGASITKTAYDSSQSYAIRTTKQVSAANTIYTKKREGK